MVFQDLRARGGPATEWTWPANLATGDTPEALNGEQTTYEYFDVLGARTALGRNFRQSVDVPNAPRVVILGNALWTSRFGADPAALGRIVSINGEPHEIFRVVVGESLALAAAGLAIGTVGALAVGRWLGTLLYGVGTTDAGTFTGTAAILLFVAFLASYVPARCAPTR
jgi:hypothetical protein